MPLRGLKASEREALNAMLEDTFKGADKDHRFVNLHKQKPLVDDWFRVYEYDSAVESGLPIEGKRLIASCGVYRQEMQYGQAVIINGGVRDVGAHPIGRGKGYGLKVVKDAVEFMRDNGCDISILFTGSHHFYEKNGYRSGPNVQTHLLSKENFQKWLQKSPSDCSITSNQIEIKTLDPEDVEGMVELYQATNAGLYFAGHRSYQYMMDHLNIAPAKWYPYLIAKVDGQIAAYIKYTASVPKSGEIMLEIEEMRTAPNLSGFGSGNIDLVMKKILEFMKEEVFNPHDTLVGILFRLSINNPYIRHLYHAGFNPEQTVSISLGTMVQIIKPVDFFSKLTPEFQARAERGLLPQGICTVVFDTSGGHPGGFRLEVTDSKCNVSVSGDSNEVARWLSTSSVTIEFHDFTPLTLLSIGGITQDDIESDEMSGKGDYTPWLEGLFSEITYDFHIMDHY
jgi:GNAT superfamily N-acetyltransferase